MWRIKVMPRDILMTPFEPVQLARLHDDAEPISEANINQTWRATLSTHSGETSAIVKWIPRREIIVEAICSIVGRAHGLPIPKPFLVLATPDTLPNAPWADGDSSALLFGAEVLDHPTLRRRVKNDGSAMERAVLAWKNLAYAGSFDEWIANDDRHASNLLYDGDEFWLIDHGRALPAGLAIDGQTANVLFDTAAGASKAVRTELLAGAQVSVERYADHCPHATALADLVYAERLGHTALVESLIEFLERRVPHIPELVAKRLGLIDYSLYEHGR